MPNGCKPASIFLVFEELRRLDENEGRDFEKRVCEITIPTQVVWGDKDEVNL